MNSILLQDIEYISKNIDIDKCNGKTFLITGANGLLARYMVEVLVYLNANTLKDKCNVVALCRNEKDAKEKFKEYIDNDKFTLIIQSVEEELKYEGSVDYIVHAASRANTREFTINPVGIISANALGTYNLLEYSRSKNLKGFLFFSSGAIYGNFDSAEKDVKETEYYPLDPLDVKSCYGESKKMAENMCYCFYKQYNIPIKIVRISHTYGPGIDLNDGRVFSDFVKSILNNKSLVINSNGKAKRPFCYISDAIIAFFLILFKGYNGEAYNLANNDNFISIGELANILTKEAFAEKNLEIVYSGNNSFDNSNREQVSADASKLYALGWNPTISVEEGFKRTVNSFLEGEKNCEL